MTGSLQKTTQTVLRFIILGTILALALTIGVSKVNASTPGQVGDAPRCTVDAVGARDKAFHPSGDHTTVKFKVTGTSGCKVRLSANSFYAPSMSGKPYSKQTLYQRVTKIFKRGTYSMTVGIPTTSTPAKGCYYQVDLTYGIHNHTPVLAYDHGKIPQCGKPTPPPQPQAKLVCQNLVASVVANTTNTYRFTATASAENTTITKYVFNFGDGTSQTVNTGNTTAVINHAYQQAGQKYTATVAVSSNNLQNVTSPQCAVTTTTPPTPETPTLLCESLTVARVDNSSTTYEFTANASASNTTITSYSFDFGDGNNKMVTTSENTAKATHAYADVSKSYTAMVTVSSQDVHNVTSAKCKVTIAGKRTPVLGATTELPNTGAGDVIGFFGATSLTGALIHRFLLRRKIA